MKLSFDEAIERINEPRPVDSKDVDGRALKRQVWVAGWGLPGWVYETVTYCETEASAIDAAVGFADDEPPRGIRRSLCHFGQFQHKTDLYGTVVTEVWKTTLAGALDG